MDTYRLDSHEFDACVPLVAAYPYNDYRHYRAIPPKARVRILLSEIERAAEEGHLWALKDGSRIIGLAILTPLPWDSEIFGLPMARLDHLITAAEAQPRAHLLDRFLDDLVELARAQDVKHLSTRVDCADVEAVQSLERKGLRLMECLVTYLFEPRKDTLPRIKTFYTVRQYEPRDREALVSIAERMFADYQSRFSADPNLPREGAQRLYVEWTKNACAGTMADYLFVAEKTGTPVGFLAYRLNAHALKGAGVRIVGQSLSAVLPEATGAYIGLLKAALELGEKEHDFIEADAPLHHMTVIRSWQRLGFRLVRAKYALHSQVLPREAFP